jgi:DNA gyrase subunit A
MLIDKPKASLEDVMKKIPGPDFPTGGYIVGREGITSAYARAAAVWSCARNARPRRSRTARRPSIVTELPYQVNKANLIKDIAGLIRDKKLRASPTSATSPTATACAS